MAAKAARYSSRYPGSTVYVLGEKHGTNYLPYTLIQR